MAKKAEVTIAQIRALPCISTAVAAEMLGVHHTRVGQLVQETQSYSDKHTLLSVGKREEKGSRSAITLSFNDVEVLADLIAGHRMVKNVTSSKRMKQNNPMRR